MRAGPGSLETAYVGLGSNQGDPLANLRAAVALLQDVFELLALSPVYETEPVGFEDQPWFLNAVAAIATDLDPEGVVDRLKEIEGRLGKATPFPNGPRSIDLDLLMLGGRITPQAVPIQVPHPRFHERRFVLAPLVDIAPDALHPTLRRTAAQLLETLPRTPVARRIPDPDNWPPSRP